MAPALLLDESSSHCTASDASTSPTTSNDAPTTVTPPWDRLGRRNPLLKRSVRNPPLWLKSAKGSWLSATDGTKTWRIFDASGGAGVSNIGHGDRRVHDAIRRQEETGIAYTASMSFDTDVVWEFADHLIESTEDEMAEVAFYSSGSEATEAAKKLAYQYHSKLKPEGQCGRRCFIARDRSYHGATIGALEVSGHKGRKDMYKQILPESTQFISPCNPYRDMKEGETADEYVERLAKELESKICELGPDTVAGFFMEPVVGAALGCVPALPGYLSAMKKVCKKYGVLFILDEIMCGMGRTGYMHAWQEEGVVPDIQLVGKALAGGYAAVSAMLVGHEIVNALGHSTFAHGHTFQNFPAACAAGLAVQKIVQEDQLLDNVKDKGEKLMKKLLARLGDHPNVGNIRGAGLFRGIEFVRDKKTKTPFDSEMSVAWRIHEKGMKDGYNVYVYPGSGTVDGQRGDHVIIAPAFNITDSDIDTIVESVGKLIFDFFKDIESTQKL